jgi:hypothetical protein
VNSLKLVLRFSYKPNTLGLCGREDLKIYELLKKGKWSDEETERVRGFVKDLKVLHAYLKAVGGACGKSPFAEEVVKACIIGWDKWEKFGKKAGELLKENLRPIALQKKLDEIDQLPAGVPLTHNFHTLYFGAVALDIPRVLSFADRCKVSLGTVVEGGAEYNKLLPGLRVGKGFTRIETPFFPVEPGDKVFLHHGVVFRRASAPEEKTYCKNLEKVLKALEKAEINLSHEQA